MTSLFDKAGLRDLREHGVSNMIDDAQKVASLSIMLDNMTDERDALRDYLREACERLADIIEGDDGEAFFEGEKFLKRHAPDIYNVIGASLTDDEPLPDFPEPTLIDRACGFIVGLLIRNPRQ